MASECVTVKIEPGLLENETEGEDEPCNDENVPTFVTVEVKSESLDDVDVDPHSPSMPHSWLEPETEMMVLSHAVTVERSSEEDHSGEQPNTSSECGKVNSQDAYYTCNVCLKVFKKRENFQHHLITHVEKIFQCDQPDCNKEFISKAQLTTHIKRHLSENRPFACDACDKAFKTISNLNQHKKTHSLDKPFTCGKCKRNFAFKANLAKHETRCDCGNEKPKILQCDVCQKVFDKPFLLKSHLRRHDPSRPYSCEQCNMKFKHKTSSVRHSQMHSNIKPYSCPFCDKGFTHAALLKPHIRIHTGEKPYECPICNKHFTHKHNMERHKIRHEKVKHLVCEVCHKKFPKESRLIYHLKTHVNEKYFICHVCPKRFSHKQNILRHYRRKHPNAQYNGKETDASVALKVWDTFKSKYGVGEPEQILG